MQILCKISLKLKFHYPIPFTYFNMEEIFIRNRVCRQIDVNFELTSAINS